jgi:serine/threonine-protein kinase
VSTDVSTHIGRRFGNYRALSILGEGGMGTVFLAEHPEIGRKVAIKVLRGDLARDPQLLGRFLNEARAANAIRHPNIIEILDSGTTEDGTSYLVMELLEGEPLAARLRRLGRLQLRDALEFAYMTASALGAAHKQGIVHRDLKPDNLFVVPDLADPGREYIKVLDFGIAKLAQHAKGDSVKTRTGTLMGTPVYMSPEQCLGTKELDLRSDIYSLGCIIFEMVCGKPPFYSEGFGELVNMHLNEPPPAPRSVEPSLPEKIEAVILRALAKKPEQRFPNMAELQASLREAAGKLMLVRGSFSPDLVRETLPSSPGVVPLPSPSLQTPQPPVHTTTFSTGSGERRAASERKSRGPLLALGGIAAAGAVAAALALGAGGKQDTAARPSGGGGGAGASSAPGTATVPGPASESEGQAKATEPAQAAPRRFRFTIATDPPGAEITRPSTGESWGSTPIRREVERGDQAIELKVEKAGFAPVTLSLLPDHDADEAIKLQALTAPGGGGTTKKKGGGKGGKAHDKDGDKSAPVEEGPAKL